MRIEEIDRNLRVESSITEPDIVWFDVRQAPFSVFGVFYDEQQRCFVRMPQAEALRNPSQFVFRLYRFVLSFLKQLQQL